MICVNIHGGRARGGKLVTGECQKGSTGCTRLSMTDAETLLMPRIPGPARRARALAALAVFSSKEGEFQRLAADLRAQTGDALSKGIARIRERLHLPETNWADKYVGELVRHFDDSCHVRALVGHGRPGYEFQVTVKSINESFLVDPEASSQWIPLQSFLIDPGSSDQWMAGEPPVVYSEPSVTPAASTLHDLERISNAPRRARKWWTARGLPKRQQPTETLIRDTCLFFLVHWRGFTLARAAGEVADLAREGKMTERSRRGGSARDEILSDTAVRKAVRRIDELLR